MIAPHPWGVLHLLVAHDGLTEGHVYRCYGALCGVLLPTLELPPATCPDDCELDVLYCTQCVHTAAEWTVEAQQAERASRPSSERGMAQVPGRIHPPLSGDGEPDPEAWITTSATATTIE